MTAERRQKISDLVQEALELEPGARTEFLDGACREDAALLEEVRSLLFRAEKGSFLEKPPFALLAEALSTPMEGRLIGPFRILREIEVGGMGEVYEVEQDAPQRVVALKLIRRDLKSEQALARFDSERRALATMNHPNIAQIFAAGTTDEGRPYFAMELVSGSPITRYCDEHRLSVRERLKLFERACEGVQHAHQKGIIHRDLKPSNILVTEQDGKAVPKIIDFGIAKAIEDSGSLSPTNDGQGIGTPGYMSPEQTAGADVDTRTDVYSLGMMLYELLLGELPPSGSEDSPRLSIHLVSLGERAPAIAENRRTDLATLIRQLRGDLEWIVTKAFEEGRDRRYSSVSELAIDIERHLRNEPVLAGPGSAGYRFGKFMRRHKVGVAASAFAILALVAGAVGAGIGLIRAREAEGVARLEANRADREAETARQVSRFMVGLFQVSDPDETKGNRVTAREILDVGTRRIAVELQGQTEVRAALLGMSGRVYESLGLFDNAEALLREALALELQLGAEHGGLASSQYYLADLLRRRGEYPEAEILFRKALTLRQKSFGLRHSDVAESLTGLGHLLFNQGKYGEAEPYFREALAIWEGARDSRVATALAYLALLYRDQGKYDLAIPLFERSLKIQEKELGSEHSDLNANLNNLAEIYRSLGRFAQAEKLFKRVLSVNERIRGPEHPIVATVVNNLAMVYRSQGRYPEAEKLYKRALLIDEKVGGQNNPNVASSLNNLAVVYREEGKFHLAEPLFLRSLAIREEVLGPKHPHVAGSLNNLALLYSAEGRFAESERLFKRSIAIREEVLGPDHPHLAVTLTNLANLHRKKSEFTEAELLLLRALEIWDRNSQPTQLDLANTLESLADVFRHKGQPGKAVELENREREIRQRLAAESGS